MNVNICCMCGTSIQDVLNLGELKTLNKLSVHYYCLLLASTITQDGQDHEGILGFLQKDIIDELGRCKFRVCFYCKKRGASVFCSNKGCKAVFHLPCGLSNGSGHQFQGSFLSTCHAHRVRQKYVIPTSKKCCPICYDVINFKVWTKILWAPCCKKNAYFHKECLQQMALSAGYFFKCPVCNDKSKFQRTMKTYGIFIPDRDASWETEPNAFQELYYRHNECNAEHCVSTKGRQYSGSGSWSVILCNACGSQGIHVACIQQKNKHAWTCTDCALSTSINKQNEESSSSLSSEPSTSSTSAGDSEPCCSKSLNTSMGQTNISSMSQSSVDSYVNGHSEDNNTEIINIVDSDEDDDVVVVENVDQPSLKCLIAQDGSVIPVRLIEKMDAIETTTGWDAQPEETEFNSNINTMDNKPADVDVDPNDMGFKITNVRSLSSDVIKPPSVSVKLNNQNETCIKTGEDYVVLKNGDNQTTIKCQSKNSEDMFTMKQALYSAMCSSYKINRNGNVPHSTLENIFDLAVKEEISETKDNGYDSSSESDVMIID